MLLEEFSPEASTLLRSFASGLRGPSRTLRLVKLAGIFSRRGLRGDAALLCIRALANDPNNAEAATLAKALLAHRVPAWHLPLLHDHVRNDAYDDSLCQAVVPGMLVLEIGTGSGLLAMLAARAGAELVVACEQDPALAVIARENIRRNGYADRVTVVAKHSRDLIVGVDLPRRADLLVSEIVDNALLGEHVLDTVEHARAQLLAPGATTIPRGATIQVALVQGTFGRHTGPVDRCAGLDVSAMNAIAQPAVRAKRAELEIVTDVAVAFRFDLTGTPVPNRRTSCRVTANRAAAVTGIAQWISIDLAEGIELSTGPGSPSTAWAVRVFPVAAPIDVPEGDSITIAGEHSRSSVLLWTLRP